MKKNINFGAYPTMIAPYGEDRRIDYGAVRALVDWYWENGCDGIFTNCHSTEITYLSLDERIHIARTVKDEVDALERNDKNGRTMSIVASGHVSDDFEAQCTELNAMAQTGVDALVLVTNRSDPEFTSEDQWIADTERLLNRLPEDILLGTYECPYPYKRLLTHKMAAFLAESGRFAFIKDTCCNAEEIKERIRIFGDSGMGIYNANGQTCLETLRAGAKGYCGIMCNYHPKLYVWLCHHFKDDPALADRVGAFLSMCSFTEDQSIYPLPAKYHLTHFENMPMSLYSRVNRRERLTRYQESWVEQMKLLSDEVEKYLHL